MQSGRENRYQQPMQAGYGGNASGQTDLQGAEETARMHAGGDQGGIFSQAVSHLGNQGGYGMQPGNLNESQLMNSHQQAYGVRSDRG